MFFKFHKSIYDWAYKKCIVGLKYRGYGNTGCGIFKIRKDFG